MITHTLMYQLLDPELLHRLMQRTGTGARVSIRELSTASGVPRSTIHNLTTGSQQSVAANTAHAIAQAIGVDVLILFAPAGRSSAPTQARRPEAAVTA
ncbi:XRE family transcriptional regulator [Streptomyces sp. Z26]|nr:XRE family transcriptional regulator [Streptomyces sp. Z26]